MTASLVAEETFAESFTTRDTVAVETPANFAMSLIVGDARATLWCEVFRIDDERVDEITKVGELL